MKRLTFTLLTLLFFSCQKEKLQELESKQFATSAKSVSLGASIPRPDHIIIVWFENKGYSQIIGKSNAPYINSLISKGTLFTNAHGLTHPSYPNYIALFSGSTQGISSNSCISGAPKTATTLYNQLGKVGALLRWYSEDLPEIGSTVCSSGDYVERHNPITIFSQVPSDNNRPFYLLDAALKDDPLTRYKKLPEVMMVTPNLENDMHDGSIQTGDAWLKTHFDKYIQWAYTHNSMLVVYFDEDNKQEGNKIPAVIVGEHVKVNYQTSIFYDHYSFTKTICSMFGASTSWTSNVNNAITIEDVWQ